MKFGWIVAGTLALVLGPTGLTSCNSDSGTNNSSGTVKEARDFAAGGKFPLKCPKNAPAFVELHVYATTTRKVSVSVKTHDAEGKPSSYLPGFDQDGLKSVTPPAVAHVCYSHDNPVYIDFTATLLSPNKDEVVGCSVYDNGAEVSKDVATGAAGDYASCTYQTA